MRRYDAAVASHDCATCHVGPEYTSVKTYDVGLTDGEGARLHPPWLRAVSRRSSYLHDASAHSLPDVFNRVHDPDGAVLSREETSDLTAFLESL